MTKAERMQRITSLYQHGHSQHEIARRTGLSQPGVRKTLIRLGLLVTRTPVQPLVRIDNFHPVNKEASDNRRDQNDNPKAPAPGASPGFMTQGATRPASPARPELSPERRWIDALTRRLAAHLQCAPAEAWERVGKWLERW
jgi:hypothetical protein